MNTPDTREPRSFFPETNQCDWCGESFDTAAVRIETEVFDGSVWYVARCPRCGQPVRKYVREATAEERSLFGKDWLPNLYGVFGHTAAQVADAYEYLERHIDAWLAEPHSVEIRKVKWRRGDNPRHWRIGFEFLKKDLETVALLAHCMEKHAREDGILFYFDHRGYCL